MYIGSPGDGLEAPHASLSLPPLGDDLTFRGEAAVPVTHAWALAVRYVPLWHSGVPSLEEWTAYTATVGGAMDAAAQAVTATWTFTTGDFTQPEVVATSPEKDTQVAAPQAVVAYFSEDVSTVGATFTLRGEEPVDGSVAYYNAMPCGEVPSCYQWHFAPYEPLAQGLYTAEVNGVTDRGGNGLEAAYNWSFEVKDESGIEEEEPGKPAREAEGPAAEGSEIESGMAGELYVRQTSYYYFAGQRVAMRQVDTWGGAIMHIMSWPTTWARRAWCWMRPATRWLRRGTIRMGRCFGAGRRMGVGSCRRITGSRGSEMTANSPSVRHSDRSSIRTPLPSRRLCLASAMRLMNRGSCSNL